MRPLYSPKSLTGACSDFARPALIKDRSRFDAGGHCALVDRYPSARSIRHAICVLERLPVEALSNLAERLIDRLNTAEPDCDLEPETDACDAGECGGLQLRGDGHVGDLADAEPTEDNEPDDDDLGADDAKPCVSRRRRRVAHAPRHAVCLGLDAAGLLVFAPSATSTYKHNLRACRPGHAVAAPKAVSDFREQTDPCGSCPNGELLNTCREYPGRERIASDTRNHKPFSSDRIAGGIATGWLISDVVREQNPLLPAVLESRRKLMRAAP